MLSFSFLLLAVLGCEDQHHTVHRTFHHHLHDMTAFWHPSQRPMTVLTSYDISLF